MDAHESREPLNDLAVDGELQALLAVKPSPAFVARVRTRIAAEPEPRTWWWMSWTFAVAAAAAAAIVIVAGIVAGIVARHRVVDAPGALASAWLPNATSLHAALHGAGGSLEQAGAVPAAGAVQTRAVAVAAPIARRDGAFDVVLDPRESAALRALIYGVRRGEVDLAPVLRASAPTVMELPPVTDIAIEPITIAPLLEGVRQ